MDGAPEQLFYQDQVIVKYFDEPELRQSILSNALVICHILVLFCALNFLVQNSQVRGIGTDIAIVSCMVFLAQVAFNQIVAFFTLCSEILNEENVSSSSSPCAWA